MLKITAVVSLVLIASWSLADRRHKKDGTSEDSGSGNLLVAGLSCDSCGSECAAACGTRHFRSCCFNYLRRKRDPDTFKFPTYRVNDLKMGGIHKDLQAGMLVEEIPEQWMKNIPSGQYKSYYLDDNAEKLDSYDL